MNSTSTSRIILLDFGHPTTENIIQSIKMSLENALSLLFAFSNNINPNNIFGISVLNSKYILFGSSAYVKKNMSLIMTKLNILNQSTIVKEKVTIEKYKHLMKLSVENILKEFKKRIAELSTEISLNEKKSLEVIIITTKTASIVAKILNEVLNKLPESYLQQFPIDHFKITQITDEERNHSFKLQQTKRLIEWIICKPTDLDKLFKNWLIQLNYQGEQIEISLSEEIELKLKCNLVACVIDPYYSSVPHISNAIRPTNNLKVLHRIHVSDLNPSMIYGITFKAYATRNSDLTWDQLQVNVFIFTELCKELKSTSQGLITKGSYVVGKREIISYYFITSDGKSLFIKNLVPNELYFLDDVEPIEPQMEIDSNAAVLVKTCLENIDFLNEFPPSEFSSGLYKFLKSYMMGPEKPSGMLGHIDPDLKLTNKNLLSTKSKNTFKKCNKHERKLNCKLKMNPIISQSSQSIKCRKTNSDLESYDTHPALLPPEVLNKYKTNSSKELPELRNI